jgi:hypothetical protein
MPGLEMRSHAQSLLDQHGTERSRLSVRLCLALAIASLATPTWGQPVTFAELEGLAVEADIVREQTNRRDGRTFSTKVDTNWAVAVGPDKTITSTVRTTSQNQRRTRRDEPQTGTFTLDEARPMPNQGGGDGIWTFADGTLTFIRTFKSGARRVSFAFARAGDGLTCTATFAFAREDGSGPVRLESRFSGRDVTILGARQVSSTCRVAKQDQAPGRSPERKRP